MLIIERFSFNNQHLYNISLAIRTEVFVIEQNVDPILEYDEFEESSQHYLIYFDEKPVGTARWRETTDGIKLERFAVLKDYRNKQIGDQLLKQVMKFKVSY